MQRKSRLLESETEAGVGKDFFWKSGSPITGGQGGGTGKRGLEKRTSYGGPLCLSPTNET